jgi:hypothetical protein
MSMKVIKIQNFPKNPKFAKKANKFAKKAKSKNLQKFPKN